MSTRLGHYALAKRNQFQPVVPFPQDFTVWLLKWQSIHILPKVAYRLSMPPNSTGSPEAPTVPLKEAGSVDSNSQILEGSKTATDTGSVLVGRYRLTELIGRGGMSVVYKALDQQTQMGLGPSVLALKVLSITESAGSFAALTAQVHRLQQLSHPNIVKLFGCERDSSIAFITMELILGQSTYEMLRRRAFGSPVPLESDKARLAVAGVADALSYAHGQGMVHGDLKPGNVMVTPDFGIKVIDFGMTRWFSYSDVADIAPRRLAATPQYASPQLMAGEEPQPSDDVFGLACVAYELLTGVHPFDGDLGADRLNFPPPQRPGLTPSEYAAVVRGLQLEREQRTPSIRQFMAEFAASTEGSAMRRWPVYIGAAAAVILGIYLWAQRNNPAPVAHETLSVQPPTPTAAAPAGRGTEEAGAIVQDCPTCAQMTVLPAGHFLQGATDDERDSLSLERPQHAVHLDYVLAMSSSDVTVADFRRFAEATRRNMRGCDGYDGEWRHHASDSWQNPGFAQTVRHPVVCVSWNDAVAYAEWLSGQTGHKYRLPSASEWEYAARSGSSTARPWGSNTADACAHANVADHTAELRYPGWNVFPCDDGYVYTAPVGSFKPNVFGLSDMLGNVLVWTQDCWLPDYTGAPNDGSARERADCREHEVRGGSWFSTPAVVRASSRNRFASDYRANSIGIRLVREMD